MTYLNLGILKCYFKSTGSWSVGNKILSLALVPQWIQQIQLYAEVLCYAVQFSSCIIQYGNV